MKIVDDEFDTRPELTKQRAHVIILQRSVGALLGLVLLIILSTLALDSYNGIQDRRRLLDCTTPTGECYQQEVDRVAEAVEVVIKGTLEGNTVLHTDTQRVAILAAYCTEQPKIQNVAQITKCIERELKKGSIR